MKKETIFGFTDKLVCSSSFRSSGLYRTRLMALHPPSRPRRMLIVHSARFPGGAATPGPRWTPWKRTGTGGDTGGDTRAAGLMRHSAGWTRGPGSAGRLSLAPRRPTGMGCSGSPPRPRAQRAVVRTPWAALPRLLLAQRERC